MKLEITNLSKAYGNHQVLDHFNLSLEEGIFKMSKPSGWGKTTLLRIILGLETADEGEILFTGKKISALFQEDRLLEQLDADGNLKFALGKEYDRQEAAKLLSRLGLDLEDSKKIRDYSGGMKRRLALARALLAEYDLLLLDEPFGALDPENVDKARALIREKTEGKIVILVSHEIVSEADL